MKILSLTKNNRQDAENKSFRIFLLIIFCAVFTIAISSCSTAKNTAQKQPSETKMLPVTQIDDAKIKELLKPNGKPLLVNFWATWCAPCREEFPDLVEIDEEYRGKIDFFTVSHDSVKELNTSVPEFLREMKAQMPTYLIVTADENTLISSIAKNWSGALPFTILYNKNGEVIYTREGKVKPEILKGEIEKALK